MPFLKDKLYPGASLAMKGKDLTDKQEGQTAATKGERKQGRQRICIHYLFSTIQSIHKPCVLVAAATLPLPISSN